MGKNLRTFFELARLGMGAALLALFAFTSVSRATVIVDSLGDTRVGDANGLYKAEDFSTTVGGQISSVILSLNFNTAAVTAGSTLDVYLYSATGSGPTGSGFNLGTITATTAGDTQYTLSGSGLNAYSLIAGSDYAIVIDLALASGSVGWEYASAGSGNTGTGGSFLHAYNSNTGTSGWVQPSPDQQRFMEVDAVPEPMTGAIMGIGALAIAAGHTLRRRKMAASPTNA